ncbi:MAG: hypothetical protein ACYTGH_13155 [Planctomycetota bacterium]
MGARIVAGILCLAGCLSGFASAAESAEEKAARQKKERLAWYDHHIKSWSGTIVRDRGYVDQCAGDSNVLRAYARRKAALEAAIANFKAQRSAYDLNKHDRVREINKNYHTIQRQIYRSERMMGFLRTAFSLRKDRLRYTENLGKSDQETEEALKEYIGLTQKAEVFYRKWAQHPPDWHNTAKKEDLQQQDEILLNRQLALVKYVHFRDTQGIRKAIDKYKENEFLEPAYVQQLKAYEYRWKGEQERALSYATSRRASYLLQVAANNLTEAWELSRQDQQRKREEARKKAAEAKIEAKRKKEEAKRKAAEAKKKKARK